jgi:hypothetical protein
VANRPNIGGHGGDVRIRQRCATLGRHRDFVIARLRHAIGDGFLERFEAAVTNEPMALDQRRRLGTSPRVRAMAARARSARRLAVKNAVAQSDLFLGRARRHRQGRRIEPAGIWMCAFGRPGLGGTRSGDGGRRGRSDRRIGAAMEGDAPNAAVDIIGNVKRAVGSHGETCRPECRLPGLFHRAGESIGEDDEVSRGLSVLERLERDVVAGLRLGRAIPRAMEGHEGATLVDVGNALPA